MKYLLPLLLPVFCLVVCGCRLAESTATPGGITIEWIYAEEGKVAAAIPSFSWLSDGTALLHDRRRPGDQQTLERYDPVARKRVDLVDAMLYEVPLNVALHFLGVPEDEIAVLRNFSLAHSVNTWGRPTPEKQIEVAHAVGKFWQYAGSVIEKMKAEPDGQGWMHETIRKNAEMPEVVVESLGQRIVAFLGTEMPFTENGGGIACLPENFRDGEFGSGHVPVAAVAALAVPLGPVDHTRALGVATGHEEGPGRATDRVGVSLGEAYPGGSQLVHGGSVAGLDAACFRWNEK